MEQKANLEFIKETKETWLEWCPKLIHRLVYDYRFYYSKPTPGYTIINSNIVEFVEKNYEEKKHSIRLYKRKGLNYWYLVVFAKTKTTIYYTDEYGEKEWGGIRKFIKSFNLASETALEERKKAWIKELTE